MSHRSLRELMDLTGRIALITGGAGHIGRTIAAALAELGSGLVIVDRDAATVERLARDLRDQYGVAVTGLATDLEHEGEVLQLVPRTVSEFGRLDALVNCAAFLGTDVAGWIAPLAHQTTTAWRRALEVNLTVPFTLARESAPYLAASGKGTIVNVSSIYGVTGPVHSLYDNTPMGNPAAYGASKAGLLQLTRWLATTLAPTVRVNAVAPGGVWRSQQPAFVERYVARTPLQRMATEEDFKGAVAYLVSDLSAYVTGQTLIVDGGWTTW